MRRRATTSTPHVSCNAMLPGPAAEGPSPNPDDPDNHDKDCATEDRGRPLRVHAGTMEILQSEPGMRGQACIRTVDVGVSEIRLQRRLQLLSIL